MEGVTFWKFQQYAINHPNIFKEIVYMKTNPDLPNDIWAKIFCEILKDCLNIQLTCKLWRDIIRYNPTYLRQFLDWRLGDLSNPYVPFKIADSTAWIFKKWNITHNNFLVICETPTMIIVTLNYDDSAAVCHLVRNIRPGSLLMSYYEGFDDNSERNGVCLMRFAFSIEDRYVEPTHISNTTELIHEIIKIGSNFSQCFWKIGTQIVCGKPCVYIVPKVEDPYTVDGEKKRLKKTKLEFE